MTKRILSVLLAFVLLFGLLPVQSVSAADNTKTVIEIPGGYMFGWNSIALSVPYTASTYSQAKLNTTSGSKAPVMNYVVTLPTKEASVTLKNTYANDGNSYILVSPGKNADGVLDINPARNAVYTATIAEDGNVVESDFPTTATINTGETVTVNLTNGNGQSAYLFLLRGRNGTNVDGGTRYSYSVSYACSFQFVYEGQKIDPTPTLTKNLTYGGHLCAPGESLTLSVEATVETGCTLDYQWYSGTNADNVTTKIEGATTASFTPPTSTPGITFYKVVVTGTADGVDPVSVDSAVARIVVREASSQSFSLDTFFDQPVAKLSGSDTVYYLKWSTLSSGKNESPLAKGNLKMTGRLPDHITIERVWTGSPVDAFDLSSDRTTLKTDDDTGEFSLNITTSFGTNPKVTHNRGKCYYLELSDGTVYTLVVDNDASEQTLTREPSVVQLYNESDATTPIPDAFFVANLQSAGTKTSVIRGTLQSDSPAILRAQVQSGGEDLTSKKIEAGAATKYFYWNKGQTNWVVVNGERLPKSGFFSGISDGNEEFSSSAFTLKPGLNVVEVYTNAFSFTIAPDRNESYSGMSDIAYDSLGASSSTPVVDTSSVVYLIDYQGESATELPADEAQNTDLASVTALRYGAPGSKMDPCAMVWDEEANQYQLCVPSAYQSEARHALYYTHSVLLSLRTAAAGANVQIITDPDGLIAGKQVGSCVLLDLDVLQGKADSGFTIRVSSADGSATKDYPVKIVYTSSETAPQVTITGVDTDVPFAGDTYAYYLDFASKNAANGKMTATLPEGATATVDGRSYTSGTVITLSPKQDFCRLTITAADGYTEKSYYFVTRYKDDSTIPYATISDSSKKLAKDMLWKWYDTLESMQEFGSYWQIFMARATGNEDGSEYDFSGKYVKDPARHEMKQSTDWSACILEIVMLGYNPYDFPRYVNGEYVEHYNYVEGLLASSGPFASNTWYHMGTKAVGAPQSKLQTAAGTAANENADLDIRSWAIASLSNADGIETKDLVGYIDALHGSQNTSGTYTSLWTNKAYSSTGGNVYTIGCVLSAIASAGADPDKQFAYGGKTPLQTIKDTLLTEEGKFGSTGSGAMAKDMVVGLGDILHGSNVWARYTLTADKYSDLIAKAKALNVDTSSMPEAFTQTTACGKAYYDLYDKVYEALVTADRNDEAKEMRPDVIWGMPYELFNDAVSKMCDASELTADDLDALEKLIAQYEAMDDSDRKYVGSKVLTKYQALVAKGLVLKAQQDGVSSKADDLYKQILALPDASNINDSNREQAKASVDEIRKAMTDADEELLKWAGASVLGKLEAIEGAMEVEAVIEKIKAIPDPIDEDSYEAIVTAREAYDKLTDSEQKQVPQRYLDKLTGAETAYNALLKNAKSRAISELTDHYHSFNKEDYGDAGWKKLTEIFSTAQENITSAKSCAQVSALLERAIKEMGEITADKLPFTDVRTSDWFYDDIAFVYNEGLFAGTSDTTFSPNTAMTRAMLVAVLYRMEGKPGVTGTTAFTDVAAGAYYADAVTWAANNGIVYGMSDKTFSPNTNLTREQMAAMMRRYASFKKLDTSAKADLSTFVDASAVSAWASDDMKWAVASELLYGNNHNELQPTANATRAQAAAILQRFATKIVK